MSSSSLKVVSRFYVSLVILSCLSVRLLLFGIFLVCIFYTAVGGIKAVMWTDTFQAVCMFGSFLAIILKGNYDAGGSSRVFDVNYQSGRVELFNFDPDPRQR